MGIAQRLCPPASGPRCPPTARCPLPHAYHSVLPLVNVSPGKADSNEDSQNAIRKANFLATEITYCVPQSNTPQGIQVEK